MKFKKIVQIMFLSASVLAMAACSTTGRHGNGAGGPAGDASGVEAAGVGDNESFGGGGDMADGRRGAPKGTYYFDYDSNVVHNSDKPSIYATGDKLVARPRSRVTVEGHTDPRGSREYNVALGERRANAVAELLKSRGASSSQVQVVSYGAERLAVPGYSEQDYQLDRRAVIVDQR